MRDCTAIDLLYSPHEQSGPGTQATQDARVSADPSEGDDSFARIRELIVGDSSALDGFNRQIQQLTVLSASQAQRLSEVEQAMAEQASTLVAQDEEMTGLRTRLAELEDKQRQQSVGLVDAFGRIANRFRQAGS